MRRDCGTGVSGGAALYFAIHVSSAFSRGVRSVSSIMGRHPDGGCLPMNGRIGSQREIRKRPGRTEEIRGIQMNLIKYVAYVGLLVLSQAIAQTTRETDSYLKQAEISETEGTIHLVANSPRPLAQTLDALRQKYGWVVDYEDPQYISKLDLVEAKEPGNGAPGSKLPAQLPGGGRFSVEFPANAPAEDKTLQIVVDSYNRSNNPGRFELRRSKQGTFFVVGAEARDGRGELSHQLVLFDVPITLPAKQRTISATLNLICRKIAQHRHISVSVGVSPRSLVDNTDVTVGGTKVAARDLVLQTLTSTRHTFYWRLLFDPNSKGYVLDIHLVRTS